MIKSGRILWFWQRIISPHMAGLASALVEQGFDVVYITEKSMTEYRAQQGWSPSDLGAARLEFAPDVPTAQALVQTAPVDSIHICQGIRANGVVGYAQVALARRGLRQWVIMESVNDSGWYGVLKRLAYRRLFKRWRARLEGVLAIGYCTAAWIESLGMNGDRVYPFAYFLQSSPMIDPAGPAQPERKHYRFIFVGRLVSLKRVDMLLEALGPLNCADMELVVVGNGPEREALQAKAKALSLKRIAWRGGVPMTEVPAELVQSDCLVLPSRHDGWGAVVSEALMVGTPVICSDACGAAGVVSASGVGGVYSSNDVNALSVLCGKMLNSGKLTQEQRADLAKWALCLGSDAGARYLGNILNHAESGVDKPMPPWQYAELPAAFRLQDEHCRHRLTGAKQE